MDMQARVVIVGGGIVGVSTAYHLARLGWRNIVVLDQGPLFHNWGSTSHAPGMMFLHNVSRTMTMLARWSRELYLSVDPEPGSIAFPVGGMELAATPERWEELKRRLGQARSWGLTAELLSPAEAGRLSPLLRTDDLYGACYVAEDCVIQPAAVVAALARAAGRDGAVEFRPHTPVTGFDITGGRVRGVQTPGGRIGAEVVVCAAGIWGPLVGRLAGVPIPLTPMQHIFSRTGPLPELAGETAIIRHPIVRHQDRDLYFRQYGDRYGFGSYRHDPLPLDAEALAPDGTPAILPFTPEHFAPSVEDAYARVPALRAAGLSEPFNGVFSFTADGFPLLGETPGLRGFWVAEAVWITHAGGVGRVMAEWLATGTPPLDLHECDLNRWPPHALSRPFIRERSSQQYAEVYDIIHPLDQPSRARHLRLSPLHARHQALGATFFDSGGWERPQWYESNRTLPRDPAWPAREGWTARNWSPIIAAEHRAVRERAGLLDLTPFTKLEVAGPGALAYLARLTTGHLDVPVGRIVYTLLLNEQGGLEADLTVTRLAPERFLVVTGAASGPLHTAWLRKRLPADGSVRLDNVTSRDGCLALWGPRARAILGRLSPDDLSTEAFPYLSARRLTVSYWPVTALRVSYAGELGWELYAPAETLPGLWDALLAAGEPDGLAPVGAGALDSLRLEKGYRLWGSDMHAEYTPDEAGLRFAVRRDAADFIGADALREARERGLTRRLCCLTLADPSVVVMGREAILTGEHVVGHVTSANFGYTVGQSVAYGYLPAELARPGTPVEIQFFGRRYPATVAREPRYDPAGARLEV